MLCVSNCNIVFSHLSMYMWRRRGIKARHQEGESPSCLERGSCLSERGWESCFQQAVESLIWRWIWRWIWPPPPTVQETLTQENESGEIWACHQGESERSGAGAVAPPWLAWSSTLPTELRGWQGGRRRSGGVVNGGGLVKARSLSYLYKLSSFVPIASDYKHKYTNFNFCLSGKGKALMRIYCPRCRDQEDSQGFLEELYICMHLKINDLEKWGN